MSTKVKVQYVKRYFKTITTEVEVPDVAKDDVEQWVREHATDLFEEQITAASLSLEDEEVIFLEDWEQRKFLDDWNKAETSEEKIEMINAIIKEYGEFTVFSVQAERKPYLESPDGLSYVMEEFNMYGGKVFVYDPADNSDEVVDKYDADYEDLPESQLNLLFDLAKEWIERN